MEAPEEVAAAQIVKGKRTKRQRVESPLIPLALTTTNSSSGEDCNMNVKNSPSWSPTSSNVDEFHQDSTEEEDMANCLILLAQGRSRDTSRRDDEDNDTGVYYNNNSNSNNNIQIKFNSRRFLETASSTGSGKVGYYVYECKTCNRTFPSFQALGGHRASHKKPKAVAAATTAAAQKDYANKKHMMMMMTMNNNLSSDEEEGNYKNISSLSLQLSNNNNDNINNRGGGGGGGYNKQSSKAKIHECSICGAEFTSGQALGGHMRRHRAPVGSSSTALSLTPLAVEYVEEAKKARNNNNYNNNNNGISLDLDLNLPAPEDDKFSFASKQQHQQQQQQQQQEKVPIVFSSRSLVDCHY